MGLFDRLFRRRRERAAAEVSADLGGEPPLLVDDAANYFGRASLGRGQLRGNGCLMLTRGALGFRMWVGGRRVTIPRDAILEVDTTRSHLGKTIGRRLLRVRWRGEQGEDRAAWHVRDLPAWLAALDGRDG